MNKTTIAYCLLTLVLLTGTRVMAQEGFGTNTPNKAAVIELNSKSKGLLIPRVQLTDVTVFAPIKGIAAGEQHTANSLMVYNTGGAGGLQPGYYYWSKPDAATPGKWVRFISSENAGELEPWRIQNTANAATVNTDNIYQQGKVAVGFTETDAVSAKQFEVKGDFKTAFERASQAVGMETSGALSGSQSVSLFNRSTQVTGRGTTFDMSTNTISLRSGRSSILSSSLSLLDNRVSIGAVNDVQTGFKSFNNISLDPSRREIKLYSIAGQSPLAAGNHFKSEIVLDGERGILFNFNTNGNNATEANTDSYMFPRTGGTEGQILASGSSPAGATYKQLEWKSLSDMTPWRIQNTANAATANTQNIYQQGKVAVGFTETDAVSEKQFDVKGDMNASFVHDGQEVGIKTSTEDENRQGAPAVRLFNNNIQDDAGAFLYVDPAGIILESKNFGEGSWSSMDVAERQVWITSTHSEQDKSSTLSLGMEPLSRRISMTATSDMSEFGNTPSPVDMKSEIIVDGARGIIFNHSGIGQATNEEVSYMFPRTAGTQGQVLTTGKVNNPQTYRQLEWENLSDLVTNAIIETAADEYTALRGDETILANAANNDVTVFIPAATAANKGKWYTIKKMTLMKIIT